MLALAAVFIHVIGTATPVVAEKATVGAIFSGDRFGVLGTIAVRAVLAWAYGGASVSPSFAFM